MAKQNLRVEATIGTTNRYTIPLALRVGLGLEIGDKLVLEITEVIKKEGKA